ncbi:MAG: efflux RND transporter permease subunit [Rhizobiales bacterium]|nr:efflux RND transporter permease subunit [Hyphomicrobiales bacterium]
MTERFNVSDWALRHRSFVWFLVIIILAAGAFSFQRLGRNEDPAFTIKTMVVQVMWPGASITDTLQQITDRLERKLEETPGLDYLKSYTVPGTATVFVNLRGDVHGRDVADTWYQVRKKINDIRQNLPQGILGPFFNDEFGDTFGIIYGFTADGFSQRELRDHVEAIRTRLLSVPDVSKIELIGTQDEKIFVEFSIRKLAGLRLDRQALIAALQAQNAIAPAGVIQSSEEKVRVEISGAFLSEEDLRRVNFVANGQIFRLADVATVKRGYADPPQPMFRVNGVPAIGIGISMRAGGDVLALGRNTEAAMHEITRDLPIGIEPHLVAEQPEVVKDSIDEFMKALWEAVAIVLAVSFLSLGLRAGAVVACAIPLVLAATFLGMELAGIDLQRVSLGALIIALGLLVDDAMITVEMMVTQLEAGADKVRAATFAYTSTAFPMLTGTAKSAAGEYTFSLFAVVAMALMISWVVAVVFAPLIGVTILPAQMRHASHEPGPVMRHFRTFLVGAMRAKWLTIAVTLALFVGSLFAMRLVPQQFFPASDRPELLVDLKLSEGASIYATMQRADTLETLLRDDPDIERWTTYIGQGAVRFYLPLNVQLANDFFAQSVVVTKSLEARERVRQRLNAALPEKLPDVVTRISALELGPPVGWPLQYRVSGPDPQKVRDIAYKVANVVASDPRAEKVNFDWIEPQRTLRLKVDQDQARLLGLSSQDLAQALNTVVTGATVTQVRDSIYLIDVVVRAEDEERTSPNVLRTLEVPLRNGKTVPLLQVATLEYGLDLPLVWRRDRIPTLTVQSDLTGTTLPETVVTALRTKIAELNATLPPEYKVVPGGTVEESAKSTASVAAAVPVALMVMLIVLMIQLQSFNRLFLVLSVAPFGLIGVVAALLLSGKPLGFVAILGVLALVGMIVRNSVILVDQIRVEMEHGRHPWDAVVEATSHRFRPILLTAAAAILGMIPIAPTVFWGPMAYAIMGGLAVATVITLVFLPALYVTWFRVHEPPREPDAPADAQALAA